MISDVEICNLALTKMGTNTITSFDDETENARRCNIFYEQARETVLRDHNWSFATKIKPLALLADETVLNWTYLYSYPADCLKIVKIYDENETDINDYKKMLSPDTNVVSIASNVETAYIEYLAAITDPNFFDSIFVQALAARMAYELSMSLTGDVNLSGRLLQEYLLIISNAKKVDAQEKNVKVTKSSSYVEAR